MSVPSCTATICSREINYLEICTKSFPYGLKCLNGPQTLTSVIYSLFCCSLAKVDIAINKNAFQSKAYRPLCKECLKHINRKQRHICTIIILLNFDLVLFACTLDLFALNFDLDLFALTLDFFALNFDLVLFACTLDLFALNFDLDLFALTLDLFALDLDLFVLDFEPNRQC